MHCPARSFIAGPGRFLVGAQGPMSRGCSTRRCELAAGSPLDRSIHEIATLATTEEDRDRYVDQVIRLLTSDTGQERVGP